MNLEDLGMKVQATGAELFKTSLEVEQLKSEV